MAVLHFPLYYSQEARGYSLLLLGAIGSMLSFYGLFDALKREIAPRWRTTTSFVLWLLFIEYLHYFGLALALLECAALITYAVVLRSKYRRIYAAAGIVIVGFIPWVGFLLWQIRVMTGTASFIQRPDPSFVVYYLYFICGKSKLVFCALCLSVVPAMFRKASFISNGLRKKPRIPLSGMFSASTVICAAWFCVPFAAMYLVSHIGAPLLTFRNIIICLPPVYLLISRGLCVSLKSNRLLIPAACCIAALSLFDIVFVKHYYTAPVKAQFRESIQSIVARDARFPNSIVAGCAYGADYLNYYFVKSGSGKRVSVLAQTCADTAAIDSAVAAVHARYVWYIWAFLAPQACVTAYLDKKYSRLDFQQFIDAGVWLYSTSKK
jgi:mannosyltransferase